MPLKEWIAVHQGHDVRVVNTWFGPAKLYIDGDLRDQGYGLLVNPSRPILSARIVQGDTASPLVEVYISALLTVKARICIDGLQIAGDVFE